MAIPLHVLILEDSISDAELIAHALRTAGFDPLWVRVETEDEYVASLHVGLDLILADYTLPQFNALDALRLLKARDLDIPFIVITGTVSEEVISEVIREGAADYLLKDRPARLGQSVQHALEQKRLRDEKRRAHEALRHYNAELEQTIRSRTAELEQALEKERELNELKARFVSMISHEFRTPLAVIQGATDLLARYEEQLTLERKQRQFAEIQNQVKHLTNLLDEILTISRSETVGLQPQLTLIDLQAFIHEVVQETETISVDRHVDVTTTGQARAVAVDITMMKQAVGNLLSNAAKYSAAEAHIGVSLIFEPTRVCIEVQDEGIGIAQVDLERIFELFHRGKNVANIPGTGLGLAIVKQVVEAHHGTIEANSILGRGSVFRIVLPDSTVGIPSQATSSNLKSETDT